MSITPAKVSRMLLAVVNGVGEYGHEGAVVASPGLLSPADQHVGQGKRDSAAERQDDAKEQ